MSEVRLSGQLVCATEEEAHRVRKHLSEHIRLTRAESGCVAFDVVPTESLLTWSVEERFVSRDSFAAHQERVRSSEWGRATAGIERRYVIDGLDR